MGLSCGNKCLKYLLFVFNFIFFLMGAGILGIGIWLKVEKGDYEDISSYDYATPSNLAIIIGIVMLFVSFLGCCGAIKELRFMILAYSLLLLIIFILELVVGGIAYSKRNEVENKLSEDFKKTIKEKYGKSEYPTILKVIDKFQNEFHCCGFDSFIDWKGSYYTQEKKTIPKSCCRAGEKESADCGSPNPKSITVYEKKGCYKEVLDFLKFNLLVVGTFAVVFAIIQIFGIVFSLILYCAVSRDQKGLLA